MADNLLKRYMQEGGMMPMGGEAPMEGGEPMEGGAPMEEAPAEGQQGPANVAEQILMQLVEMLKVWETTEYASDEERWQSYTEDVANLIRGYIK